MVKEDENGCMYYSSLDDIKADGITPVKVTNLLQFFTLRGKTTTLIKDNIEPIPNLQYAIFSSKENKYYIKNYRNWSLDMLYWYRRTLTFSGEDVAVANLRHYVADGNVYLLFTPELIESMKLLLKREYKSQFTDDGTMQYKVFIELMEQSIKYEDYRSYGSHLTGYKTLCNQFETKIKELWAKTKKA
jgi:hypothetical protein